jgi:hypothetical protein
MARQISVLISPTGIHGKINVFFFLEYNYVLSARDRKCLILMFHCNTYVEKNSNY